MNSTVTSPALTHEMIVSHDLRTACFHELGHAIVARRNTDFVTLQVIPQDDERLRRSRKVTGQAISEASSDPLATAAVGWAGIVCERLQHHKDAPAMSARDWLLLNRPIRLADLSITDRAHIRAVSKDRWDDAIQMALNTIIGDWAEILTLVEALENDFHKFGRAAATWECGQWAMTDARLLQVNQ